jgi:hypothetical protein
MRYQFRGAVVIPVLVLADGASAVHVCLPWWKAVFAWMVSYFMCSSGGQRMVA